MTAYLSFNFCRFIDPLICLSFSCETKFMLSFLLICLSKSIPVFSIRLYMSIASNKWFRFVDSDNFDNLGPLLSYISFLISFNNSRLDMIIVSIILVVSCYYFNFLWVIHIIFRHGSYINLYSKTLILLIKGAKINNKYLNLYSSLFTIRDKKCSV